MQKHPDFRMLFCVSKFTNFHTVLCIQSMIQSKPNFQIVTDSSLSQAKFSLKEENLAHVFDILRNNLYSDKILAVIREYSTNAYDSHVESGNSKTPIEVTIPSVIDPIFQIRDFGTGLSEDDVFNIFSSYGASTKRQSNELVGTLGMGSKSGFAYADSFTVTSWHGGLKKVYEAFIDESKIGTICKVHEEVSDEPQGLAVTISVNSKDIRTFIDKAQDFYFWFNPRPVFKNYDLDSLIDSGKRNLTIYHESDTCLIYLKNYSYTPTISVKMGNILYPIPSDCDLDVAWLKNTQYHLIINVEIGDVSFTTSRESLEIKPATVSLLNEKIEKIKQEVYSTFQSKIDECANGYEALRYYNSLPSLPKKLLSNSLIWHNKPLDTNVFGLLEWTSYVESCRQWKKAFSIKFDTSEEIAFIINDGGFPTSQLRDRSLMARDALRAENKYNRIIFGKGSVESAKAFLDAREIQGAKIYKLSSLSSVVVKSRSKKSFKKTAKVFKWNGKCSFPYSGCWDETTVDASIQKVYVDIDCFKPFGWSFARLKKVTESLNSIGVNVEIFGVKKGQSIDGTWIKLQDYINSKAEEIITSPDYINARCYDAVRQAERYNKVNDAIFNGSFSNSITNIKCPHATKVLGYKKSVDCKDYDAKTEIISMSSSSTADLSAKINQKVDEFRADFQLLLDKYPLLNYDNSYSAFSGHKTQEYIKYINAMYSCGN